MINYYNINVTYTPMLNVNIGQASAYAYSYAAPFDPQAFKNDVIPKLIQSIEKLFDDNRDQLPVTCPRPTAENVHIDYQLLCQEN